MSDFDFDELDKAVTGALGDDTSTPVTNTPEPAREAAVAPERSDPPRQEPIVPERTAAAPAARRSAGRFMDVVHPSSDMRTKQPGFTPPRPQEEATPQANEAPAPALAPQSLAEEASPWNQPLESPFLPDAKVEKRPLGAFPADEAPVLDEPAELLLEEPDEPRIEAHAMPDPIDFAALASTPESENEDTGAAVPIVEETPEVPVETAVLKEEAQPAGPASITQQYTEQPSSAPSSGAIYDTENYHAPLAQPPRKRSGIWVGLWIFLLVVLGAGAGVAFYLFVLPML